MFLKKIPAEFFLFCAAIVLIFFSLNVKGIWTQEYRWLDICQHMLVTGDYWHPYLDGKPYYDKPLLSYWFIIGLAKLHAGIVTKFILRLPSAFASLMVLWSVYFLSKQFFNRETGLLSAWFLLTTFYFVFWGRVASADMLNVAAIMLALVWYFAVGGKFTKKSFKFYLIFYLLLVVGALLKGLIAPVIVILVLLPELLAQQNWRNFLQIKSLLAAVIATSIYLAPFLISAHTQTTYGENGLVEVFRENILRFFKPFDHEGAWYIYFIYFPLYTLIWAPLILMALVHFLRTDKSQMLQGERFLRWAVLSIFIFLSLSGSRRSYYILPIVPFGVMLAAQWWEKTYAGNVRLQRRLWSGIFVMYFLLCVYFVLFETYYWG